MNILIAVLTLLLLALTVLVVSGPLRSAAERRSPAARDSSPIGDQAGPGAREPGLRRDELEASREAKYREIRDAEMDFRTGKLSESDYRALDAELRAEALVILDGLSEVEEPADPPVED